MITKLIVATQKLLHTKDNTGLRTITVILLRKLTQKAKFLNFAKSSVTFICFYFATSSTRTLTYNTFECLSNAREDSCLFPSLQEASVFFFLFMWQ